MVTELLTLRRPTRVHELLNSVPKPKGSLPKNSLPNWTIMELEQKLPFVKAPDNLIIYSRGKIGNKIWKNCKDFVLDDPYCLDVSYTYDPLHDEHLRDFFLNKNNIKRVKEQGLVSKNGNVICTLKAFNEYRRYLKRVHTYWVNKERKRKERLDKKSLEKEKSKKCGESDAKMRTGKRKKKVKMAGVMAKLEREGKLKEEGGQTTDLDRRIRDHKKTATKFQQQKIPSTLCRMRQADAGLRKRRIKRIRERKKIKEEKDRREWKEKMEYQQKRIEYIEELLKNEAEDFAYRVELRNEIVEKQRKHMDDMLQRIKSRGGKKEKYVQKRRQSRQLAELLIGKYLKQDSSEDEKLDKKTVEKTVFKTMLATDKERPNNDKLVEILEEIKIRLAEQTYLPPEVTDVIDKILDNSIEQFLWKKVDLFINDIINSGIQTVKNSKQNPNGSNSLQSQLIPSNRRHSVGQTRRNTIDTLRILEFKPKRDTTYSPQESRSSQSLPKKNLDSLQSKPKLYPHRSSIVSFGKVDDIKMALEEDFNPKELKSVRERQPTPVPSLSDIAEAIFESPVVINGAENAAMWKGSSSDIDMIERKELLDLLKYLSHSISQRVYSILEREMKPQEQRMNHISQKGVVNSIVRGIIKQGNDYSLNIDELESISQSIAGIILQNSWKGQERHRYSFLPYKSASKTSKSSV